MPCVEDSFSLRHSDVQQSFSQSHELDREIMSRHDSPHSENSDTAPIHDYDSDCYHFTFDASSVPISADAVHEFGKHDIQPDALSDLKAFPFQPCHKQVGDNSMAVHSEQPSVVNEPQREISLAEWIASAPDVAATKACEAPAPAAPVADVPPASPTADQQTSSDASSSGEPPRVKGVSARAVLAQHGVDLEELRGCTELKPIATKRSKSGYLGVYPARHGRWQAQVQHRSVGGYSSAWEAGVAVVANLLVMAHAEEIAEAKEQLPVTDAHDQPEAPGSPEVTTPIFGSVSHYSRAIQPVCAVPARPEQQGCSAVATQSGAATSALVAAPDIALTPAASVTNAPVLAHAIAKPVAQSVPSALPDAAAELTFCGDAQARPGVPAWAIGSRQKYKPCTKAASCVRGFRHAGLCRKEIGLSQGASALLLAAAGAGASWEDRRRVDPELSAPQSAAFVSAEADGRGVGAAGQNGWSQQQQQQQRPQPQASAEQSHGAFDADSVSESETVVPMADSTAASLTCPSAPAIATAIATATPTATATAIATGSTVVATAPSTYFAAAVPIATAARGMCPLPSQLASSSSSLANLPHASVLAPLPATTAARSRPRHTSSRQRSLTPAVAEYLERSQHRRQSPERRKRTNANAAATREGEGEGSGHAQPHAHAGPIAADQAPRMQLKAICDVEYELESTSYLVAAAEAPTCCASTSGTSQVPQTDESHASAAHASQAPSDAHAAAKPPRRRDNAAAAARGREKRKQPPAESAGAIVPAAAPAIAHAVAPGVAPQLSFPFAGAALPSAVAMAPTKATATATATPTETAPEPAMEATSLEVIAPPLASMLPSANDEVGVDHRVLNKRRRRRNTAAAPSSRAVALHAEPTPINVRHVGAGAFEPDADNIGDGVSGDVGGDVGGDGDAMLSHFQWDLFGFHQEEADAEIRRIVQPPAVVLDIFDEYYG